MHDPFNLNHILRVNSILYFLFLDKASGLVNYFKRKLSFEQVMHEILSLQNGHARKFFAPGHKQTIYLSRFPQKWLVR